MRTSRLVRSFLLSGKRPLGTIVSILSLSAVGAMGGCSCGDDDDEPLPFYTLETDQTEIQMGLNEIVMLRLFGDTPFDGEWKIAVDGMPDGIALQNAEPGRPEPGGRELVEFHTSPNPTYSVVVQLECLEFGSGEPRFSLFQDGLPGHRDVDRAQMQQEVARKTVSISCTPDGGSETVGTTTTGTTTSTTDGPTSTTTMSEETGESTSGGETGATTGSTDADFDLLCTRTGFSELLVYDFEGDDPGAQAVDIGGRIGWFDRDPASGAVVGGLFSEKGASGFALWDSAEAVVDEPPSVVVADPNASAYADVCISSEGAVFGGFGLDAMFCDFDTPSCVSLGLSGALVECECAGSSCAGIVDGGLYVSSNGGQSFAPSGAFSPSVLRSNDEGLLVFYNGSPDTIVSPDMGVTTAPAVLPAGSDFVRAVFVGDDVAFLADNILADPILVRSDDAGQTWATAPFPGLSPIGRGYALADGRVIVQDGDQRVFISGDSTASDWPIELEQGSLASAGACVHP